MIFHRQPDLYEDSPASSEYSTGSTLIPHLASEKPDQIQAEVDILHQNIGAELQSMNNGEQHCLEEQNKGHAKTNEGNYISIGHRGILFSSWVDIRC